MTVNIGTLVLYHKQAAIVRSLGEKYELELQNGRRKSVRGKDFIVLHEGPLSAFEKLNVEALSDALVKEAWELFMSEQLAFIEEGGAKDAELLADMSCDLQSLAELLFPEPTLEAIWASFKLLNTTPYFKGDPDNIIIRSPLNVENEQRREQAKKSQEQTWREFFLRLASNDIGPADQEQMKDLENLAYGNSSNSRILKELGIEQNSWNAHKKLVELGYWEPFFNPFIIKNKLRDFSPELQQVPSFAAEERLDLTHLPCYAIDDSDSTDPDDAISPIEDGVWVHISDVAALVKPASELDQEALERVSTLYLPDQTIPMLPKELIKILGLGLAEHSKSLSFCLRFASNDEIYLERVSPALIKVQRFSYEEAEELLATNKELQALKKISDKHNEWRSANGAIELHFPDFKFKIDKKTPKISLRSLARNNMRQMIAELMIMTGFATAKYCHENNICIPYIAQNISAKPRESLDSAAAKDLSFAQMMAVRKQMKPGRILTSPDPHAGLGLSAYSRPTSPMRRYIDLLVHQQLRAHLKGEALLDQELVLSRIATMEVMNSKLKMATRESFNFWILQLFKNTKQKRWRAILVDKFYDKGHFYLPELGYETRIVMKEKLALDSELMLELTKADPYLNEISFKIIR